METIDKGAKKKFDSVKIMRKIRDEISLEIMDMNYTEEKEYIAKLLAGNKVNGATAGESVLPNK